MINTTNSEPSNRGNLRASPSVQLWHQEIERIMIGERNMAIWQIGDAGEYINDILFSCPDWATANSSLIESLERYFSVWHPSAIDSAERIWYSIDLLRTFTPPRGLSRLIELFKHPELLDRPVENMPGIDLRLEAIHALGEYFCSPGGDVLGAYHAFVAILNEHRQRETYSGEAFRLLLAIGHQDLFEDPTSILENEFELKTLVKALFDPKNFVAAQDIALVLVERIIAKESISESLEALDCLFLEVKRAGGMPQFSDEKIVILDSDKLEMLSVSVHPDYQHWYWTLRSEYVGKHPDLFYKAA